MLTSLKKSNPSIRLKTNFCKPWSEKLFLQKCSLLTFQQTSCNDNDLNMFSFFPLSFTSTPLSFSLIPPLSSPHPPLFTPSDFSFFSLYCCIAGAHRSDKWAHNHLQMPAKECELGAIQVLVWPTEVEAIQLINTWESHWMKCGKCWSAANVIFAANPNIWGWTWYLLSFKPTLDRYSKRAVLCLSGCILCCCWNTNCTFCHSDFFFLLTKKHTT